MKKLYGLMLLMIVLSLMMICGSALADDSLVAWDKSPLTSSDSDSGAGTDDRIDPGNTNGTGNYASTEVEWLSEDTLQVTIKNAYPGYQSYIKAVMSNISSGKVLVTKITVTPSDSCILLDFRRTDGGSLTTPFSMDINEKIPVMLVTRVRQSATQYQSYTARVVIDAQQDQGGDDDSDFDTDTDNDTDTDTDTDTDNDTDHPESIVLSQEPVKMPAVPVELPYTGVNVALLTGTGLGMGVIGLVLRRKK